MTELLLFDDVKNFTFKLKPIPISPDLRVILKIAQILLVLHYNSKKKTASISKIQMFLWAFDDYKNFLKLRNIRSFDANRKFVFIHYNPYINRTCDFSNGYGFTQTTSTKRLILTDLGKNFVNLILKDVELLKNEKELLKSIGKSISESFINKILKGD